MFKNHPKIAAAVIALAAAAILLSVPTALLAKYIHTSNDVRGELVPGEYQELVINCNDGYDSTSGYYHIDSLSVTTADKIYPVYVRVMINLTWQNDAGEIYGAQPQSGRDYTLTFNSDDWVCDNRDGKYYCYTDVPVGADTEPLIGKTAVQKLIQTAPAPDGYRLTAEIAAQSIQAVGKTSQGGTIRSAAVDAWGERPMN